MKKRVLILGGGFGGTYAAMELDKLIGSNRDYQITLINRENFFLFTPMLHEVASGEVNVTDIVNPIRRLLRYVTFLQGDVTEIDLVNKKVSVKHCEGAEADEIGYDYLLLALGSATNFFNLPGLQEKALTMKSLKDAIDLRNAVIASLEEAEFDAFTGRQQPLLTYVVAGGGFAGIETIASLNDFVRESIYDYPHLKEDMVRMVLIEMLPHILPELGEELGAYAAKKLSERKVELKLETKITGVSPRGVELADGTAIKFVVLVWTAGVTANPLLRSLPCKLDRGRVVVNQFMEVPEFPGVWALGDCAMVPDPDGKPYPPTAQHAMREGTQVGKNMVATITGQGTKQPFVYKSIGALAAIGHRTGVAKIGDIKVSGFVAWLMWRTVYLLKLPHFEKKARVAMSWFLDILFPCDVTQFSTLSKPLQQNEDIPREDYELTLEPQPAGKR